METFELDSYLADRLKELNEIIRRCKLSLNHAPDGTLIINHTGKQPRYYNAIHSHQEYLNSSQIKLIQSLAQKSYHKKVLVSAKQEAELIQKVLKLFEKSNVQKNQIKPEEVFDSLPEERKALVIPIVPTDEMYVKEWLQHSFETFDYYPAVSAFTTQGQINVRSKSELIIANMLEKHGVPYIYEPKLYVGYKTVRPDFLTLNCRTKKEYYWEHFGMMDDTDYIEKMVEKMNRYKVNDIHEGDKLICTYETKQFPLSIEVVETLIQKYLL